MRNQKFNEHKQEFNHGQGLVEYALILVGVVVVAILALVLTGETLESTYCRVAQGLGGEECGCVLGLDSQDDIDELSGNADDYFQVEDNLACMTGNGKSRTFLHSCSESFGSNDIVINATNVTVGSTGKGSSGFDILFRVTDSSNHYKFTYHSNGNAVRFWKVVSGKWILLSNARVPKSWKNEILNFRIEVRGSNFKAYQDGSFILQANDSMFTEGQAGLRNMPGSKTCLDELSVAQLP